MNRQWMRNTDTYAFESLSRCPSPAEGLRLRDVWMAQSTGCGARCPGADLGPPNPAVGPQGSCSASRDGDSARAHTLLTARTSHVSCSPWRTFWRMRCIHSNVLDNTVQLKVSVKMIMKTPKPHQTHIREISRPRKKQTLTSRERP